MSGAPAAPPRRNRRLALAALGILLLLLLVPWRHNLEAIKLGGACVAGQVDGSTVICQTEKPLVPIATLLGIVLFGVAISIGLALFAAALKPAWPRARLFWIASLGQATLILAVVLLQENIRHEWVPSVVEYALYGLVPLLVTLGLTLYHHMLPKAAAPAA